MDFNSAFAVSRVRFKSFAAIASLAEAISTLLTSYLHMMNNRLGVLILEEVYLAHMIIRALDGSK